MLKKKGRVVYHIKPDEPLCKVLKMLNDRRIGALLVIDGKGCLQGVISERDVLRTAYRTKGKMCDIPVRKIMTPRKKLVTAGKEDSISDLMATMTKNRVRHVPILDGGKVIGILSIGDVVKNLLEQILYENQQLQDYISGKYV
jgi:CBS domain-containing protein